MALPEAPVPLGVAVDPKIFLLLLTSFLRLEIRRWVLRWCWYRISEGFELIQSKNHESLEWA